MNEFSILRSLPSLALWDKMKEKRRIISFDLEVTARCNNDCRHCYICLPAGDKAAKECEPIHEEIMNVADQAVDLGALWCLITGGEPLIRDDFEDIYLGLKERGLLVSVFTNACLIDERAKFAARRRTEGQAEGDGHSIELP